MSKQPVKTNEEQIEQERQLHEAYVERSKTNFMLFAKGLTLKSGYGPQSYNTCAAPFQLAMLETIAPSLYAEQQGTMPPLRRIWVERTKKASKDTDIAIILAWMTAFATRPMLLQVGAADRDQAGIVRRRMTDLLFYNQWLEEYITIKANDINGKLAQLDIVAADIAGSHGETPDVLVINELSHVTKWEFVQNLLDNAAGVPQGLIIVATNAGIVGTKAHKLRENAKTSDNWHFHAYQQPAPWLTKADLEEAKQSNSPSRFRRLFYGVWSSGRGDALEEEDVDRCFDKMLKPLDAPEEGWQYIAGLDLGISHDHSGAVVLGINVQLQKIRLATMKAWEPSIDFHGQGKKEVDLQAVEDWCYRMWYLFRITYFGYDPTQAKLMAQRLLRRGVPMKEVSFSSGSTLTEMAVCLVQAVENGILMCYEDEEGRLRRDFGKFNIVEKLMGGKANKDTGEKPASYKLEAISDEFGHADVGTAFVIALPRAMRILEVAMFNADDILATPEHDNYELGEGEIECMDPELRDIYYAYADYEAEDND